MIDKFHKWSERLYWWATINVFIVGVLSCYVIFQDKVMGVDPYPQLKTKYAERR